METSRGSDDDDELEEAEPETVDISSDEEMTEETRSNIQQAQIQVLTAHEN